MQKMTPRSTGRRSSVSENKQPPSAIPVPATRVQPTRAFSKRPSSGAICSSLTCAQQLMLYDALAHSKAATTVALYMTQGTHANQGTVDVHTTRPRWTHSYGQGIGSSASLSLVQSPSVDSSAISRSALDDARPVLLSLPMRHTLLMTHAD